MALRYRNP